MMHLKRNIIFILFAFVLSSCANRLISDKSYDSISSNEKALVVFSAEINQPEDPKKYHAAATIWKNINREDDFIPQADSKAQSAWNHVLYAYIVNPGKYDLTSIIFTRIEANFFKKSEIITSELSIRDLINFEIKGGEVVYLGHITFNNNGSEITYKVLDKYEEAYEEAKSIFPKLLHKLNKHIIYSMSSTKKAAKIINTKTKTEKILY